MNILWFSIGSGPKQHGPAQQQLNRLLKEMMKEEDNLSPHLQSIAHEIQKQGEKSSIKNLSSAVPALGDAKQELLEAESARAQMLSQWKTFLQQSVVKWREFTASFQASESAHQQGLQAARYAVKRLRRLSAWPPIENKLAKMDPTPSPTARTTMQPTTLWKTLMERASRESKTAWAPLWPARFPLKTIQLLGYHHLWKPLYPIGSMYVCYIYICMVTWT